MVLVIELLPHAITTDIKTSNHGHKARIPLQLMGPTPLAGQAIHSRLADLAEVDSETISRQMVKIQRH